MEHKALIIFVCEHGAAKSIMAAAYFNKLASERNLDVRAIARGTNPDGELSPKTVAGLQADGLSPTESAPQKLTLPEVESAQQIISFCELSDEYQNKLFMERWDDIPPVGENYVKARDAILEKIYRMLK